MHHAFWDELSDTSSPLQRLPVRLRLLLLAGYVFAVVLTPLHLYWLFILYGTVIICAIAISRLPFKFILSRLKEISPFIFLVLISIPFMYQQERWLVFARCLLRAVLSALAMVVVLSTARFSEILEGLGQMKFPPVFIRLLSFMYRYLFVLEDEFEKMQRSFISRKVSTGNYWLQLKGLANMVGVLFIRAFERSERIYLAMCARGLNGKENY